MPVAFAGSAGWTRDLDGQIRHLLEPKMLGKPGVAAETRASSEFVTLPGKAARAGVGMDVELDPSSTRFAWQFR
jgi:hypothetical protein